MARIRSVHPGLFTDEAFVSCSPLARLLFIGLWTEADDLGVFEWKPVTIKMRLMPVDNVDIPALLIELAGANMVKRYAAAGREYGAVRNFCRYQRPKKPKSVHSIPPEFRTYVGSDTPSVELEEAEEGASGEPAIVEPPRVSPKSEPPTRQQLAVSKKSRISPQMEDGGWRMEDGEEVEAAAAVVARTPRGDPLEAECRALVGQEPVLLDLDFGPIRALLAEGLTKDDIRTGIAEALARASSTYRFRAWRDFVKWIRTAGKNRLAGKARPSASAPPPDNPDDPRIDFGCGTSATLSTVRSMVGKGRWPDLWGPRLGEPGCRVPEKFWVELRAAMPSTELQGAAA